jgi:hypothetical protein
VINDSAPATVTVTVNPIDSNIVIRDVGGRLLTNIDLLVDNAIYTIENGVLLGGGGVDVINFDSLTLNNPGIYKSDINSFDLTDIFFNNLSRVIIQENTLQFHAADTTNDNIINSFDLTDVFFNNLGRITLDSFDLIDTNGNRLNELNFSQTQNLELTLIQNGDTTLSGYFLDEYVVLGSEIV